MSADGSNVGYEPKNSFNPAYNPVDGEWSNMSGHYLLGFGHPISAIIGCLYVLDMGLIFFSIQMSLTWLYIKGLLKIAGLWYGERPSISECIWTLHQMVVVALHWIEYTSRKKLVILVLLPWRHWVPDRILEQEQNRMIRTIWLNHQHHNSLWWCLEIPTYQKLWNTILKATATCAQHNSN